MKLPVRYSKVTWQERRAVREEYVRVQEGLCYYCKTPLDVKPVQSKKLRMSLFPKDFLKYPVHLHHCHKTDLTLGAVHSYCNGVLWQYHGE